MDQLEIENLINDKLKSLCHAMEGDLRSALSYPASPRGFRESFDSLRNSCEWYGGRVRSLQIIVDGLDAGHYDPTEISQLTDRIKEI